MNDVVARLRAMNQPYPDCAVPDRAVLARRGTVRMARRGAASGSVLAGLVALAVAMTGSSGTQSLIVTTTPTPTPSAAVSMPPAPPAVRTTEPPSSSAAPASRSSSSVVVPPASPAPESPGPLPSSPAPAETERLVPVFWQGPYGGLGFFGRQIVRDAANNFCQPDTLADTLGGNMCIQAHARAGTQAGSGFLGEYGLCIPDSRRGSYTQSFAGADHENQFDVYDEETNQVVRSWVDPESYRPADFTLDPGDCVYYLWHLPFVTTAGTPFVRGHKHHILFRHYEAVEMNSEAFVAP